MEYETYETDATYDEMNDEGTKEKVHMFNLHWECIILSQPIAVPGAKMLVQKFIVLCQGQSQQKVISQLRRE